MIMENAAEFKAYVAVAVYFKKMVSVASVQLTWEDGHTYQIDRVIDIRPGSCGKGPADREIDTPL